MVEVGSCHFFLAIGGSLYGVFSGKLSFAESAIPDIEYDVPIIKDSYRPHSHGVFVLELPKKLVFCLLSDRPSRGKHRVCIFRNH